MLPEGTPGRMDMEIKFAWHFPFLDTAVSRCLELWAESYLTQRKRNIFGKEKRMCWILLQRARIAANNCCKEVYIISRSCSCGVAPRDISEITIITVNIRKVYKIITKLPLPTLLEALRLHLTGSSQELSHTEKHSTGKTRKCEKKNPENFLKKKIILFAPKYNCGSKFCKEAKHIKRFKSYL